MIRIAYAPIYKYQLPEGHRFPMVKYELIPEQLLYEGTVQQSQFFEPPPLLEETLLLTHTSEYWHKLNNQLLSKKEIRAIGFPMTKALIKRGLHISNGTLLGTKYAKENGIAMNIAGGTHHAFTDRGEGFCVLNDIAIAANYLLHHKKAKQILVIDLDVHQGNGTAQIFRDNPNVFTFSMHGAKNYPTRKERSDLDIGLPDHTADELYLTTLEQQLIPLVEKLKPDFLFYLAGVDVLATDQLGRLSLTLQGCKERDQIVLSTAKKYEIPVVVSMGGGYSARIAIIIEAHANTFRVAHELFA